MNANRWKPLAVPSALVLLFIGWITWPWPIGEMPLYRDEERTRQSVLKRVPLGSEKAHAQRILEANGFECRMLPRVRRWDESQSALRCERYRLYQITGWIVVVYLTDERVTEIAVNYSTTFL